MKKGDIIRLTHHFDDCVQTWDCKVNWVVEDHAGITQSGPEGASLIIQLVDGKWVNPSAENSEITMLIESDATFQSEVEHMTDEQLMASIDSLRGRRHAIKKKEKVAKTPSTADANDIVNMLLALPEDERQAMMKKLGIA